MRRSFKVTLFAGIAAALAMLPGMAAAFPEGDITYIIPFNPGGESDVTARLQEPAFKETTGKSFVIQYRTGGGGATAWAQLNSLPKDGHTIMGINLPHIFLQPMGGNVGYETEDIESVSVFQLTPHALVVTADSPYQTLEDFIEDAKARPAAITVAGTGTNSANQVAQQTFDQGMGIETTYVPFTGTAATTAALIGKQVAAQWGYPTVAVEQGENVRMLAVAMDERHPLFPDVPTFKEKGLDYVDGAWRGIAVPKGTSDETKQALAEIFGKINQEPAFRQKMEEGGYVLVDVGPDEMDGFMEDLGEKYREAGRLLGLVN